MDKFDPTSNKAKLGLEFQESIRSELSAILDSHVADVRQWLLGSLSIGPDDVNLEEKLHGDVTFVLRGRRRFVECCLVLSDVAHIDEQKRLLFFGKNRHYCFGIAGRDGAVECECFVPSFVMRKYLEKCPLEESDDGWLHRRVPARLIGPNIRASVGSTIEFVEKLRKEETQ